ncbi:hypothetical protein ACS0TY_021512 [Phlomoides rotata]
MTTNISEAINGVLKGTRRLPITAIVSETFTRSKNAFRERELDARNLQQRNQTWPDDVFNRIADNNALGVRHTVDLYNHARQTASVTVRVIIEYALTNTSGFFAPLADVEDWGEPNFQLRHNPARRIRRRGRDDTTRIHNEMDWPQTRARQQYQAQDGAATSAQGSRRRC